MVVVWPSVKTGSTVNRGANHVAGVYVYIYTQIYINRPDKRERNTKMK